MSSQGVILVVSGTALAAAGLLQVVGDTVYALDRVYPGDPGFAFANLVAMTWHVLLTLGLVGVALSLWSALGRIGAAGVVLAIIGMFLLMAAELITQLTSAIPVPLIAASAPVTGVGAVLLAVALIRAGHGLRAMGAAAAVVGLYALAAIVPTSIGPSGANYFVIAGWGLCWTILGATALVHAPSLRTGEASAGTPAQLASPGLA